VGPKVESDDHVTAPSVLPTGLLSPSMARQRPRTARNSSALLFSRGVGHLGHAKPSRRRGVQPGRRSVGRIPLRRTLSVIDEGDSVTTRLLRRSSRTVREVSNLIRQIQACRDSPNQDAGRERRFFLLSHCLRVGLSAASAALPSLAVPVESSRSECVGVETGFSAIRLLTAKQGTSRSRHQACATRSSHTTAAISSTEAVKSPPSRSTRNSMKSDGDDAQPFAGSLLDILGLFEFPRH